MYAFPVPTVVAACPAYSPGLWPSQPGLGWPESRWSLVAAWPVSLGLPASRVSLASPRPHGHTGWFLALLSPKKHSSMEGSGEVWRGVRGRFWVTDAGVAQL